MRVLSTPRTVDSIGRPNGRKKINPQPSYQRENNVWNLAKKQLLIDSILRGYDLPKFYFRPVVDPEFKWEVVDGQQRLTTIWQFLEDEFLLGEDSRDLPQGNLCDKKYSELSADDQDTIGQFTLAVYEIQDTSEVEVRDLFLRLQNGTALNPAEKRNAMVGELRDFVARLAGEGSGSPHQAFTVSNINSKRNAWDDLAAHILRLELEGGPADIKADNLRRMYETNKAFDDGGLVAKKLERVLGIMARTLKTKPPEMDIKWGFVDLYLATSKLDDSYVLKGREADLCDCFTSFEEERRAATLGDPTDLIAHGRDGWDRDLYDYIQAFQREGNKRANIQIRHGVYMRRILRDVRPNSKDSKRSFLPDERLVIWRRAGERCAVCHEKIELENMHADHVLPHSKGGETSFMNAQCLCASCNLKKGASGSS